MAVRSKVGLNGERNIESKPKKTRQGNGKTRRILQHPETRLVRSIGVREDNR